MKVVGTVAARVEQNENLKETIGEKNGVVEAVGNDEWGLNWDYVELDGYER